MPQKQTPANRKKGTKARIGVVYTSGEEKKELQRFADLLDTYIGVYFSSKDNLQMVTLGEHLAMCIDHLLPDPFTEFLNRKRA